MWKLSQVYFILTENFLNTLISRKQLILAEHFLYTLFSQKVFCTQYSCRELSAEIGLTEKCLPTVQSSMHENFLCILFRNPRIENTCLFHSHRTFSVHIFLTKKTHSCRNFPVHIILTESFLYTIFLQRIVCRELSEEIGHTEKCLPTVQSGKHICRCAYYSYRTFSSENEQTDKVMLPVQT